MTQNWRKSWGEISWGELYRVQPWPSMCIEICWTPRKQRLKSYSMLQCSIYENWSTESSTCLSFYHLLCLLLVSKIKASTADSSSGRSRDSYPGISRGSSRSLNSFVLFKDLMSVHGLFFPVWRTAAIWPLRRTAFNVRWSGLAAFRWGYRFLMCFVYIDFLRIVPVEYAHMLTWIRLNIRSF